MKFPAKKIVTATILCTVMLNAGFSFANEPPDENSIYFSKKEDSAERKREFWEKFRESVKPREEYPRESRRPREIHPHKSDRPREVHPKEVHPRESD